MYYKCQHWTIIDHLHFAECCMALLTCEIRKYVKSRKISNLHVQIDYKQYTKTNSNNNKKKLKTPMSILKNYRLLIPILFILLSVLPSATNTQITGKVVQIQPVALDIIISIYDRAVILFTHGIDKAHVQLFENSIKNVVGHSDGRTFNKTIFGVCDIDKDKSGKLKKYGDKPSVQIINSLTNYQLLFPEQKENIEQFFNVKFPKFIQSHTCSQAKLLSLDNLPATPSFLILATPQNNQSVSKFQKIHQSLFDYLSFFNTTFLINIHPSSQNTLQIYYNRQPYISYAQSAVNALLNFTQFPSKEEINEFVDFVNVQTSDNVTVLNDENYYRVFGSSVQWQILFVYRQQDAQTEEIKKGLQEFKKAAISNRYDYLNYQRVLFATGTTQFLSSYFSDTLLESPQPYSIILTKTDYSNFQLRKYIFQYPQLTKQSLLQFIENVKLKRINPKYKSQKPEDNTNKTIRKIVGDNFYQEIFQQSQKSVLVLFVDSKEGQNGGMLGDAFREFVGKYHGAYAEFMNVGIFDLGKNQHKALTISTAPELILFQRSNKKKPQFFKGVENKQTIKNWLNYAAKDFTIPQNYGQPPIALGGASTTTNDQL